MAWVLTKKVWEFVWALCGTSGEISGNAAFHESSGILDVGVDLRTIPPELSILVAPSTPLLLAVVPLGSENKVFLSAVAHSPAILGDVVSSGWPPWA